MIKNKIQKPISLMIDDTRTEISEVINHSGLTPTIIELILKELLNEISVLKCTELEEVRKRYDIELAKNTEEIKNNRNE